MVKRLFEVTLKAQFEVEEISDISALGETLAGVERTLIEIGEVVEFDFREIDFRQ